MYKWIHFPYNQGCFLLTDAVLLPSEDCQNLCQRYLHLCGVCISTSLSIKKCGNTWGSLLLLGSKMRYHHFPWEISLPGRSNVPSFDNLVKDMKGSHLDPTKVTDWLLIYVFSTRVDLITYDGVLRLNSFHFLPAQLQHKLKVKRQKKLTIICPLLLMRILFKNISIFQIIIWPILRIKLLLGCHYHTLILLRHSTHL